MISIVIPAFNQAKKLSKCLESLYNQTYKNTEIIVVNDGSTDETGDVVRAWEIKFEEENDIPVLARGRSGFKYIKQDNTGANIARNIGSNSAKGEYVIFCDADVVMQPTMLEEMNDMLDDNPDVSFVYSSFYWGRKLFKLWPYDAEKLKQMPYIHTTSLMRRGDFPKFDSKIKRFQDWDLWLSIAERGGKGMWIDKPLFKVATGGTMSNWLPKFAYKLLPFLPIVKKYNEAMAYIKAKHKLK